jgi:hypothetical protein
MRQEAVTTEGARDHLVLDLASEEVYQERLPPEV